MSRRVGFLVIIALFSLYISHGYVVNAADPAEGARGKHAEFDDDFPMSDQENPNARPPLGPPGNLAPIMERHVKSLREQGLLPEEGPAQFDVNPSTHESQPEDVDKPHFLAAMLMVKNELGVIIRTLDSIRGHVDALVVLDTGSKDGTQDFIKTFCESHGIALYMEEREFIDFSTNRNQLLNMTDPVAQWGIMLDANEELQNGTVLRAHLQEASPQETCFMVIKQWNSMLFRSQVIVRLSRGWHYTGVVHEHLTHDSLSLDRVRSSATQQRDYCLLVFEDVRLYQDRSLEAGKSRKRWVRDVELLHGVCDRPEYCRPRDVFYLARTYNALGDWKNAAIWFEKRVNHQDVGFVEEIYFSMYELGLIHSRLIAQNQSTWEVARNWYMRAYEYSHRAEPLVKMAEWYRNKQDWHTAFMFALQAARSPVPTGALLFMDWSIYSHWRFSLLGIISYYTKDWEIGRAAILEALKDTKNRAAHDYNNLKLYPPAKPYQQHCDCLNTCETPKYPSIL